VISWETGLWKTRHLTLGAIFSTVFLDLLELGIIIAGMNNIQRFLQGKKDILKIGYFS